MYAVEIFHYWLLGYMFMQRTNHNTMNPFLLLTRSLKQPSSYRFTPIMLYSNAIDTLIVSRAYKCVITNSATCSKSSTPRHIRLLHSTKHKCSTDTDESIEFSPRGDTLDDAVRVLGDMFGECRMDIDDARESIGTTYYSDDALYAQQTMNNVLAQYKYCIEVAGRQNKDTLNRLKQSWALKLEQLKGEYEQMTHEASD